MKRYTDGTFKIARFHVENDEPLILTNALDAQTFVSWWYSPWNARINERAMFHGM